MKEAGRFGFPAQPRFSWNSAAIYSLDPAWTVQPPHMLF